MPDEDDKICPSEKVSQSPDHSPGLVQCEEELARLVWYPGHINDDGRLNPDAISKTDLKKRGFSLNRLAHASLDALEKYGETRAKRSDIVFRGMCVAICRDIRSAQQREPVQRAFCVRDTATKTDISHSDVVRALGQNKTSLAELRTDLADLFSAVRSVKP